MPYVDPYRSPNSGLGNIFNSLYQYGFAPYVIDTPRSFSQNPLQQPTTPYSAADPAQQQAALSAASSAQEQLRQYMLNAGYGDPMGAMVGNSKAHGKGLRMAMQTYLQYLYNNATKGSTDPVPVAEGQRGINQMLSTVYGAGSYNPFNHVYRPL